MRLIDADALMEQFAKLQMVILLESVEEAEIASMIGNAPTIDPVARGRWMPTSHSRWVKDHVYRCSVCGNILDMYGVNAGRGDANYCPNCGARMEGEENDDRDTD